MWGARSIAAVAAVALLAARNFDSRTQSMLLRLPLAQSLYRVNGVRACA